MARPVRMDYPDTFYHVLSRGNERKEIFWDEKDFLKFLDLLGKMVERFALGFMAMYSLESPFIYSCARKRPIFRGPSNGLASVIRSGSTVNISGAAIYSKGVSRVFSLRMTVTYYVLYHLGRYLNREIGEVFGVGYTAVPGGVKRGEEYMRADGQLERMVRNIIADI